MTTLSTSSSPLPSPSPHPSIPPTSTPTPTTAPFSASSIDTSTALHLLSLPPLLHPISPHLAALHLARLQLLLSVSTVSGGVLEWWCNSCGGLREGLGGAARGRRRRNRGQVIGAKGVGSIDTGTGTGTGSGSVMTNIDGVEHGLEGTSTAVAGSSSNSTSTSNTNPNPPGLAATRTTRKSPNCTICGASFKRPKPDPAALALFPPARRARRSKAAYSVEGAGTGNGLPAENAKVAEGHKGAKYAGGVKEAEDVKGAADVKGVKRTSSGVVKTKEGVSRGVDPTSRRGLDPGSAPSMNSGLPNPTPGADHAPTATSPLPTSSDSSTRSLGVPSTQSTARPLLLSTPRLAHISDADPSPPTYPPPPSMTGVKRPASPPTARGGPGGAGGVGAAGGGGRGAGVGPTPGKKRKKSGLAKLLAESKARDEGASGGRWGLG
ncbi:hypothetical protein JCM24511_06517 [Saitozyma sp. JCM 24511]|nr:hypothetical protein JCM24511_06517 [Saitozyma sp. JCM 24511]